ncbi:anthocyanidin 5,3-O-glucosyltransferase-like [Syzygium oleosum]|uniref:anthocyanidin 5,3-O-glucosyltransferase-like n=1 Tax=Syzygium oleosum TaxID=219896 RepID=UPI0011D226D0|nr:anthocyanidin 5,3-O-glucosyltransferase-like [Syzygium oleosum]
MRETIVLYPSPLRGHIVSMLELGRLIHKHHPRFSVLIILSSASTAVPVAYDSSSVTVLRLPSAAVDADADAAAEHDQTPFDLARRDASNLRLALADIAATADLRALVIDVFSDAAFPVAAALGVPTYYFFTSGAVALSLFLHFPTLHGSPTKSFKDLGDETVNIPGLPPIKALDLPGSMLDRGWRIYGYFLDACRNMISSSGIIVNTSESLETRILSAIREGSCVPDGPTPPIFAVGPLVESKGDGDEDSGDERERKHECLSWLDSQPSRSVVFLCFGSRGRFSAVQLKEMALGLERSGARFLWVVRPPPQDVSAKSTSGSNDDDASLERYLPEGFLERTRERGMVVKSWAPQIQVLNHGSVGGFVTHCGWNSTIEAVHAGVPMVAWPLYAEQKVNRAFLVGEAALALPLSMSDEDGFVSADELAKRVTDLMMGSGQGKVVRERVLAARDGVLEALSDGGSSQVSLGAVAALWKRG